jgi:hypothetical protein
LCAFINVLTAAASPWNSARYEGAQASHVSLPRSVQSRNAATSCSNDAVVFADCQTYKGTTSLDLAKRLSWSVALGYPSRTLSRRVDALHLCREPQVSKWKSFASSLVMMFSSSSCANDIFTQAYQTTRPSFTRSSFMLRAESEVPKPYIEYGRSVRDVPAVYKRELLTSQQISLYIQSASRQGLDYCCSKIRKIHPDNRGLVQDRCKSKMVGRRTLLVDS